MYGYGYGLGGQLMPNSGGIIPIAYGEMWSDTYQRASLGADYTKTGSQSCTIVDNELVISGGAGSGTFAETLQYTGWGYTSVWNHTQTLTYTIETLDAGVGFLGVGIEVMSGGQFDMSMWAGVFISTGGLGGKLRLYKKTGGVVGDIDTSVGTLALTLGDELTITYTVDFFGVSCTATNNTQGGTVTASFTPTMGNPPATTNTLPYIGYPSLVTFAGTQNVLSWSMSSTAYKYADYAFIGDSITEGFSASSTANTYIKEFETLSGANIVSWADPNCITGNAINILDEVVAFAPQKCFLMIGGNDIAFGVATGTWQANIDTIIDTLETAGITVILLYATPRANGVGTNDVTPINDYYDTKPNQKIDTYTPLATGITANPTYFNADLVHPNDAGMDLIATTINSAL